MPSPAPAFGSAFGHTEASSSSNLAGGGAISDDFLYCITRWDGRQYQGMLDKVDKVTQRKVKQQVKVLIKNLAIFSLSQQAVSADIIPNSAVEIFSPETEGTKT